MGLYAVTPLSAPSPAAAAERSPSVAALLSFAWPGLGQLYRGRRRSGLLLALPVALVLAGLAVLAAQGPELLALRLLSPPVALSALALTVLLGAWRVAAIVGAARSPGRLLGFRSVRRLTFSLLLVALVVASHLAAGVLTWSLYRAGSAIFQPLPPAAPAAGAIDFAAESLASPADGPVATQPSPAQPSQPSGVAATAPDVRTDPPPPAPTRPLPAPAAVEMPARMNVLLVGLDTGSGRDNTDTLIVASFNRAANRIVMLSLPRDTAMFPLYDGGTYSGKVNSLMSIAAGDPERFPDGGMATLVRQMEHLVGVPIHYYASIDIAGFRALIELAGGVGVDVEQPIHDPSYKLGLGPAGFHLQAGRQHLDSWQALAYVRSRKGSGGSDFERAKRQQQLLLALRHSMAEPKTLANLPTLIDAAGQTLRTNLPVDLLPELVGLLQGSLDATVETVVLGPPTYSSRIPPEEIGGLYALRLNMHELARLSRRLFGDESRYTR